MNRRALKEMSRLQLRGKWGMMALRQLIMITPYILLFIAYVIGSAAIAIASAAVAVHTGVWISAAAAFIVIEAAVVFFVSLMKCGFIEGLMQERIGEASSASCLFKKFGLWKKVLGIVALSLLAAGVFMGIILGINMLKMYVSGINKSFSLLFMPITIIVYITLYYLLFRFSMVIYIVVENPYTGVFTALKQSWNLMRGNVFDYVLLILSFIGWYLLAILTLGIGLLFADTYVEMTSLHFYYGLKEQHMPKPDILDL